MTDPYKQADRARWLRDLLCGALIGAGAILPGVSGGVLAVVFDVYRPMMETLAHPGRGIRKYWHIFLPLGIGWAVGFLGLAKGISAAYALSDAATIWLFIGLIAGTFPALWREAGKEGHGRAAWIACGVCALSVFLTLFYVRHVLRVTVTPNFGWYNFCGALWGASVVLPASRKTKSSAVMRAAAAFAMHFFWTTASVSFVAIVGAAARNWLSGRVAPPWTLLTLPRRSSSFRSLRMVDSLASSASQSSCTVVSDGEYVYVGSVDISYDENYNATYGNGSFMRIKIATGEVSWLNIDASEGYYWTGAALTDKYAIVPTSAGTLKCIDKTTGDVVSTMELGAVANADCIADPSNGSTFYQMTHDGKLHVISLSAKGVLSAQKTVDLGLTNNLSAPAVFGDNLIVGGQPATGSALDL